MGQIAVEVVTYKKADIKDNPEEKNFYDLFSLVDAMKSEVEHFYNEFDDEETFEGLLKAWGFEYGELTSDSVVITSERITTMLDYLEGRYTEVSDAVIKAFSEVTDETVVCFAAY